MMLARSDGRSGNNGTQRVSRFVSHRGVQRYRVVFVVVTRVIRRHLHRLHARGDTCRHGVVLGDGPRAVPRLLPLHEKHDEDDDGENQDTRDNWYRYERFWAPGVGFRRLGSRRSSIRGPRGQRGDLRLFGLDQRKRITRAVCWRKKRSFCRTGMYTRRRLQHHGCRSTLALCSSALNWKNLKKLHRWRHEDDLVFVCEITLMNWIKDFCGLWRKFDFDKDILVRTQNATDPSFGQNVTSRKRKR